MMSENLSPPALWGGDRGRKFALLATFSLLESGAFVAMAAALKAILIGALLGWAAAGALAVTGLAAAGLLWARAVAGEAFGLSYAQAARDVLARQAVRAARGRGRLGAVAVRMTSDLEALKLWGDRGLCGGLSALLGGVGAVLAGALIAGPVGAGVALIGPLLALGFCGVLAAPLTNAVRQRRRARGLLSAKTGDLVTHSGIFAAYGAEDRAVSPVVKKGEGLVTASLSEARWAQLLLMPAVASVPLGVAAVAAAAHLGWTTAISGGGWAGVLFTLGLAATATAGLTAAFRAWVEFRVARARLADLAAHANDAPAAAPQGEERLAPGPGLALSVDGTVIAPAGAFVRWDPDAAEALLARVRTGGPGVALGAGLGAVPAETISASDWARRVAYVGPDHGLVRGRLPAVLAAKRPPSPEAMAEVLTLLGLPGEEDAWPRMLDPSRSDWDERIWAKLRLARALAHRPRVVVIHDAWISQDRALLETLRAWAQERAVTVVLIAAAAPALRPRHDHVIGVGDKT